MAKWVNKYPNSTGYEAETEARNALGKTVSLVLNPRTLHYDKGNGGGVLPAYTVRLKYVPGYDPHNHFGNNTTLTQVSSTPNVWDATKVQNVTTMEGWIGVNEGIDQNLLEVIAANTTGVTSMARMFQNCRALTSVPRFDTSSCTTTQYMFLACYQLTYSPLFDTSSVTNMEGMFQSCLLLTAVPLLSTSSCTSMDRMFRGCQNVESGALALYQQASTQTNVPSHTNTFTDCGNATAGGAEDLAQIPQDWGGTEPSDPYNPLNLPDYTIRIKFTDGYDPHDLFDSEFHSLSQVSTSPNVWDITRTDYLTDWSHFVGTDQGVNNDVLEILGANSTRVTNMSEMFCKLESLTSVAIFDTRSVTNMSSMFAGCNEITTIPLFDTSSVINMSSMFNDCDSLSTVPLLNTSNVQYMDEMFNYCMRVQSGALALYQQASTQTTPPISHYNTFYWCGESTESGRAELAQIPNDWGGNAE